jgi:hypothetical protein
MVQIYIPIVVGKYILMDVKNISSDNSSPNKTPCGKGDR